ncbi:Su-z-2 [Drosophila busckii]|uniref:Su-z-2 n=1 Tax=Drosophila busckii TaxID=30019 RepID=A0A0M5J9Q9_DROBS|nr:Su-z-2 [Drosophila busckii]
MEKPRTVQQLSEFNDLLTCRICQGYMIDPTTFDCCSHTFCRSCILKHLLRDVHCPQCKASGGSKHISEDNLSLSLEYHPAMLKNCSAADKPQVYYLQCPAGLRVGHLRRFLCSKYDIDAESRQVEVEVTYEDEVLPQNFTLMDVGYCYKWERHAPMAFRYRILLFDGEEEQRIKNDENNLSKINKDNAIVPHKVSKSVTFADDVVELPSKTRGKLSKSSKRATGGGGKREDNNGYTLSNFKSLRSNDMRYSDYGVSSTTAANQVRVKCEPEEQQQAAPPVTNSTNMMSMVSIPQSQLSKAVNFEDELSYELKTANKKNQLKLKIELNNLKVRPSVPKSAEPRLETVAIQQQLDLETYAKNIGLKPIEPSLKLSAAAAPSNGATVDASNSSSSSSSSSHRKRKKKHSKEPKDANGKRKKLHAEISSQTDGKMKMKITTTPHNHKSHKLELKRAHSLAGGELLQLQQQLEQQLEKTQALNKTLGEESRSINNLMPVAAAATAATPTPLPASAPLPPSLFKTFASTGSNTTKPKPAPPQLLPKPPKPALNNNNITNNNNNNNNNNRKPVLPITPHFVVPQAPLRQAPTYQLQRYASTPSSIASSANKQPKRALSLDETQQQQQQQQLQKQPRLDLQQQQRLAKLKPAVYAPQQTRCYGPELAPKPAPRQLCPASLASLSQSRPRLPAAISYAPMPSLEIVRLTAAAVAAAAATRLMGPPVAPAKRASASIAALPLPVPTMVKSPPLSIALAAQRQHSNSNNSNSSNTLSSTFPVPESQSFELCMRRTLQSIPKYRISADFSAQFQVP